MFQSSKALRVVIGVVLALGSFSISYGFTELWEIPMSEIDGEIAYDGVTYYLEHGKVSWEFTGGDHFDEMIKSELTLIFKTSDGSKTLELTDASWKDHTNLGKKESYTMYLGILPTKMSMPHFEGSGTWCGRDKETGTYFWGTWKAGFGVKTSYFDGLQIVKGVWTVQGSSDNKVEPIEDNSFQGELVEFGPQG